MPTSPILNEAMIIAALEIKCANETNEHTRVAGSLALLDAFDRNVTREAMSDTVNTALVLNETMRSLGLCCGVIRDLESGELSTTKLGQVRDALIAKAETHRVQLLNIMKTMAEMPWDEDTLH